MKNAHLRFGWLTYVRSTEKTPTSIKLRLDPFIGEVPPDPPRQAKAHLIVRLTAFEVVWRIEIEQRKSLGRAAHVHGVRLQGFDSPACCLSGPVRVNFNAVATGV
jgi:hypothetical protein